MSQDFASMPGMPAWLHDALRAWQADPQAVAASVVQRQAAHPAALNELVLTLGAALQQRQWRVATAESCTGGGIAAALTAVAGSSAWVEGGYVTYSNQAKVALLGVPEALLQAHGAVSLAVVQAMVLGAQAGLQVACAVAVSGVAGPGGGSAEKPVGTVCIAWAAPGDGPAGGSVDARSGGAAVDTLRLHFPGDRDAVRAGTLWCALFGLLMLALGNRHAFSRPG